MHVSVAVVGGGPAGLAAVRCMAAHSPHSSVALIDAGPDIAHRIEAGVDGSICGSGGAALCNDGKWSFGSAGSALRHVDDTVRQAGMEELLQLLALPEPPTLPGGAVPDPTPAGEGRGFQVKRYPSIKTDLAHRLALVRRLEADMAASDAVTTLWGHRVTAVHVAEDGAGAGGHAPGAAVDAAAPPYRLEVCRTDGSTGTVTADAVVLATGRLGPLALPLPEKASTFRRFSAGVRVVVEATPDTHGVLNPTWVWNTTVDGVDVQFRTFCWCAGGNGRVVNTDAAPLNLSLELLSGTTDPPSEPASAGAGAGAGAGATAAGAGATAAGAGTVAAFASRTAAAGPNFGIVVRVTRPPSPEFAAAFHAWMQLAPFGTDTALKAVPADAAAVTKLLRVGIAKFTEQNPAMVVSSVLGPCVEGVGSYPAVDPGTGRVEAMGPALYAAGDGGGLLRGLVPSFLSGYNAGVWVSRRLATQRAVAAAAKLRPADAVGPCPPPPMDLSGLPALPFTPPPGKLLLYEVHCFLAPLNPDEDCRARYYVRARLPFSRVHFPFTVNLPARCRPPWMCSTPPWRRRTATHGNP